jgi:hypothetical protein
MAGCLWDSSIRRPIRGTYLLLRARPYQSESLNALRSARVIFISFLDKLFFAFPPQSNHNGLLSPLSTERLSTELRRAYPNAAGAK